MGKRDMAMEEALVTAWALKGFRGRASRASGRASSPVTGEFPDESASSDARGAFPGWHQGSWLLLG